ncbi:M13-type metalloendopeptidase [Candidatus Mycoplasma pogonae]
MTDKMYKKDFYRYINQEWLKQAQIPGDRSSISGFGELDINIEKLLMNLSADWANGKQAVPSDELIKNYVEMYKLAMDKTKRAELGFQPVVKYLNQIQDLKCFKDVAAAMYSMRHIWSFAPFFLYVSEDFLDPKTQTMWMTEPGTILPSTDFYGTENGDKLLVVYKNMVIGLLKDYGMDELDANEMVDKALKFDNLLKDFVLTSVEKADYTKRYNPIKIADLPKNNYFDISALAAEIAKQPVKEIIVSNKRFLESLDKLYNAETFENFKSLLFIKTLLAFAHLLSDETRIKASEFSRAVTGTVETQSFEKHCFNLAKSFFSAPLGIYYGKTYFGEVAKQDVVNMIHEMIGVYKTRLEENTWLSETTKQKALLKLSKLKPMIGYPDEMEPYYNQFNTISYQNGGDLVTNNINFSKAIQDYNDSLYLKEENPNYWSMSAATVNAYFHPMKNQIVFPAAILNLPFYSIERNASANFGAIGAVIAHEISHAFDNNGARFDENGRMNNWWTKEDEARFKEKQEAIIELYNDYKTEIGNVNGKLTVSENIADTGGFACALEAAQKRNDFDAKKFLVSWAEAWRQKAHKEYKELLLKTDVHAPAEARANVQIKNCDLFYDIYDVVEGDEMFLPKEKRIKIW